MGLDELVQRDAQRRLKAVTAVTAGALAAMLAMGLLTIFALTARADALRQRAEAEGLVEFMLTDLRDKLKGVGRLDVMTAVNQRALAYYSDEDLRRLPPASLERRARVLHAMGEDDETLGNDEAALAKFREASRTTAALLAKAPNDPDRIFAHAQSEFWIGRADYTRERYEAARPAFRAYKRLADRLVAIAPDNPKYLSEAGYANGDLLARSRSTKSVIRRRPSALHAGARKTGEGRRSILCANRDHVRRRQPARDGSQTLTKVNGDLARRLTTPSRSGTDARQADGRRPAEHGPEGTWIGLQRAIAWIESVSARLLAPETGCARPRTRSTK